MLLLKLLFLHEGNLSQSMCSTMIGMFVTLFELLPCPIHCGIVPAAAKEKFTKEEITQLFLVEIIFLSLVHNTVIIIINWEEDFFIELQDSVLPAKKYWQQNFQESCSLQQQGIKRCKHLSYFYLTFCYHIRWNLALSIWLTDKPA